MPILLSHNTSLELLRSVPPQIAEFKRSESDLPVERLGLWSGMSDYPLLQSLGVSFLPVHFLVPSSKHQVKSRVCKLHRTHLESIPAGLAQEIAPGIYTASPELTFIQMATTTSLVGAIVLGHELCGTYSHFARMASGFYERPALASVESIKQAIGSMSGMYGLARARQALRWVRDSSASPMETVISCMLHLPLEMGGAGKVAPELNWVVKLDRAAQRITGTKTCRVDTAYPSSKTGIEFDGKDYHRDKEKDRLRREALAHMGWTIYAVDVDATTSYAELRKRIDLMDSIPQYGSGGQVDHDLGAALLERLLHATRFGVGPNGTLFGAYVPTGSVKVHF